VASCGGNLLLNISPKGDGSIPEDQQASLGELGAWLKENGEAIYGSRAWITPGEGPAVPAVPNGDWKGRSTAILDWPHVKSEPQPTYTDADFRFTTKGGSLYAIGYVYPAKGEARLKTFASSKAKIERVTLVGGQSQPVTFHQTADALVCTLPRREKIDRPYTLRIEGSLPLGL
jgi:alpha-L-fucosidase